MRRTDLVLVHGESQNDPRYNEFLAFTLEFVEALRTGTFLEHGSERGLNAYTRNAR